MFFGAYVPFNSNPFKKSYKYDSIQFCTLSLASLATRSIYEFPVVFITLDAVMKNFIQRHFVNKMSPFQLFVAVSLSSSRIIIPFWVWQISICLHGIGTIHLCNISTLISKTDLSYVSGQKLLCVFCHEGSTIAGLPQAMHPCSPIILYSESLRCSTCYRSHVAVDFWRWTPWRRYNRTI